jgi:hypothetical protein
MFKKKVLYRIDQEWIYGKNLISNDDDEFLAEQRSESYILADAEVENINNNNTITNLKSGIVPVTYLRTIPLVDHLNKRNNEHNVLFLATDNFSYKEEGDLDFIKGQLIISEKVVDDNWFYGSYLNDSSKCGIFPNTVIKRVNIDSQLMLNSSSSSLLSLSPTNVSKSPSINNEVTTQQKTPSPSNSLNASVSLTQMGHCLRQATAIKDFDYENIYNKQSDDGNTYLKLTVGDYLLVTERLDHNWLIGENEKHEKGLFPETYIQFNEDISISPNTKSPKPSILNRTQRSYTLDKSELELNEPPIIEAIENDQSYISNEPEINEQIKTIDSTYCKVEYDFRPELSNEIGCFEGDYLKIVYNHDKRIELPCDWLPVMNSYNKTGVVPFNFVSLIDKTNESHSADYQKAESIFNDEKLKVITKEIITEDDLKRHDPIYNNIKEKRQSFVKINDRRPSIAPKPKIKRKPSTVESNIPTRPGKISKKIYLKQKTNISSFRF